MGLIEVLIGITRIFVSLDFVAQDEVEQIDKKIFTPILWKDGIVKRCIGIFAQIYPTVDVATPHHVLRHCSSRGKLADRTQSSGRARLFGRRFCSVLSIVRGGSFSLSGRRLRHPVEGEEEQK